MEETMSNYAKTAIMQTFRRMLKEMAFDQISVSALTQRCGIHRNTFYAYYRDIYQLLNEWMRQELGQLALEINENTWEERVRIMLYKCRKNKRAVNHILQSRARDQLERFVFSAENDAFNQYVAAKVKGKRVPKEFILDLSSLCRYAFFGVFLQFVWNNMETNIDMEIRKLRELLSGLVEQELGKMKNWQYENAKREAS